MRILITGSSGQIGTNLALWLLQEGCQLIGLDKRPNGWTTELESMRLDLSLPYATLTDKLTNIGEVDLVVHLAAHAKVHELVLEPHRALENIIMTFNILEYCRRRNLPLIYAGSREVYGNSRRYFTKESYADFAFAASPYAAGKISGEALVYSYARCYGLRYLVFRFSNVYGRYDNDLERMERVIPLFIQKVSSGQPITVYGEQKILDFTYIDDCIEGVCAGINLLLDKPETANHTINLAFGQGNSLVTVARYVGEALGRRLEIIIEPARIGEVTHYVANLDLARALLNYKPTTQLRDGIFKAVRWNNKWHDQFRAISA